MAEDKENLLQVTGTPQKGRVIYAEDSLTGMGRLATRSASSQPEGRIATKGSGSVAEAKTGAPTVAGPTGTPKE